jgi:hypothetical protein
VNLKQINEFRIAHGLTPLAGDPLKRERSIRRTHNQQARAEADKATRSARNSNKK